MTAKTAFLQHSLDLPRSEMPSSGSGWCCSG